MQALRRASFLARLVLAWFALSLGVAVASPLVKPQSMELVCSAGGAVKLLVKGEGGPGSAASPHTLDCPLCLMGAGTPPPAVQATGHAPQALSHALRPAVAAHIAGLTAAPLPARGPPAFS